IAAPSSLSPYTTLFRSSTASPLRCSRSTIASLPMASKTDPHCCGISSPVQRGSFPHNQVKLPRRQPTSPQGTKPLAPNRLSTVRSEEHTSELQSRENLV